MSYAYTVDDSLEATGFLVREEQRPHRRRRHGGAAPRGGGEGGPGGDGGPALPERRRPGAAAGAPAAGAWSGSSWSTPWSGHRRRAATPPSSAEQVLDAIADLRAAVAAGDLTRLERQSHESEEPGLQAGVHLHEREGEGDAAAAIQAALDEVDGPDLRPHRPGRPGAPPRSPPASRGCSPAMWTGMRACSPRTCWRPSPPRSWTSSPGSSPKPTRRGGQADHRRHLVLRLRPAGSEEAQRLVEGRSVTVRFSRDWSGRGGHDGGAGGGAGGGRAVRRGAVHRPLPVRDHPAAPADGGAGL